LYINEISLSARPSTIADAPHRTSCIVRHFQRDTKMQAASRHWSTIPSRFEHLLHNERRALIMRVAIAHQQGIDLAQLRTNCRRKK